MNEVLGDGPAPHRRGSRSSGAKPCFAKCASLTLLTQGLQQQAALLVSM